MVKIKNKENKRLTYLIEWAIYMVAYALVLIAVSVIFPKTIYIDNAYYGLYGLVAAVIIYILNKTIKPILFWLTLPITGITLGLFYPFLNVFILNIVDLIMGNHFIINGILMSFVVACLISIMNLLMENLIIEPFLEGKD